MTRVGFNVVKRKVIDALNNGTYQHETSRSSIETKNLLAMGLVSSKDICDVIKRSRGQDHSSSPHHFDRSVQVHLIRREDWYVKFYFVDPDTVFISVHK